MGPFEAGALRCNSRARNALVVALVASIFLLAACSGSSQTTAASTVSPSAVSSTTTRHVDYRATYVALAAPMDVAIAKFDHVVLARSRSISVVLGLIRATSNFESAVLRVQWPGRATESDIRTLTNADTQLSADLTAQPPVQNASVAAAYLKRVAHDERASNAAAKAVRADLGLPTTKQ